MKKYKIILFAVLFSSVIVSCDPDRNPSGTYYAALKGTINKTTETINLGDTLKFSLLWPDQLSTITPLGDTRTETVNSLQYAWFVYRIFRIDTIVRKVYSWDSTKVDDFLTEGTESRCGWCYDFTPYFQNNSKPFRCVLNLLPKVKGLFFIEIVPQGGAFKINRKFEGLFTVNFDVADKHLNIVSPHLTAGWEQAMEQRDRNGFGVYCFRVN